MSIEEPFRSGEGRTPGAAGQRRARPPL